jgi:hypothetical protein
MHNQPDDPANVPVIPVDVLLHLAALPFCGTADPSCPCRSDEDALQAVATFVQQGLMGEEEARRFVEGRTV